MSTLDPELPTCGLPLSNRHARARNFHLPVRGPPARAQVWKAPVASLGAAGLQTRLPLLEAVRLNLYDPDYYETADCQPLGRDDVPDDFPWMNQPVTVFTPRQIGLVRAMSEPFATADGLIADNDSRPLNTPNPHPLATPPRCFALKWYRTVDGEIQDIPCRFATRFSAPPGQPALSPLRLPEVMNLFSSIHYCPRLSVTEYAWGLDRQFMTRDVEPARLVFWEPDGNRPAVLGQEYETAGIRFELDLGEESSIGQFLRRLWDHPQSGVVQTVVLQVLYAFLAEYARNPVPPGSPPWMLPSRPSVFVAQSENARPLPPPGTLAPARRGEPRPGRTVCAGFGRAGGLLHCGVFDTDAFGNGTSDVIRRNLYVSAVERVLATRQQARGRRRGCPADARYGSLP